MLLGSMWFPKRCNIQTTLMLFIDLQFLPCTHKIMVIKLREFLFIFPWLTSLHVWIGWLISTYGENIMSIAPLKYIYFLYIHMYIKKLYLYRYVSIYLYLSFYRYTDITKKNNPPFHPFKLESSTRVLRAWGSSAVS